MQLVLSVFALTVATLTLALAARRLVHVTTDLVYARYVAVGGMVAFSVERTGDVHHVVFDVGGPAVFHNVTMRAVGVTVAGPPAPRHTMSASDGPLVWEFSAASDAAGWVLVSWVRPYLEGIESEAIAQRLDSDQLYEWRWYTEPTRFVRTMCRGAARRHPRLFPQGLRDIGLYGRWRRTTSSSRVDLIGPTEQPPPAT